VHREERGKGYGSRCLRKLCAHLLTSSRSLCLTVNHQNKRAVDFYSKLVLSSKATTKRSIYVRDRQVPPWKRPLNLTTVPNRSMPIDG
jgi:ribosomal protein S18 acetylase RimI-like enzyme